MSESEVQALWRALNDLRASVATLSAKIDGNHELMSEVRKDVKDISMHGCVRASQHKDHEDRIRDVEKSRNMLAGISSLAGAVFGVVGGWLLRKIGGDMKLDLNTILQMIQRKSVSWFGAAVVGAWSVIAYPDFRAWLEQGMAIVGPVGVGALVASIVMSTKNEIQGVNDVTVALNTVPPGATIVEAVKGEVVPK